MKKSIYPVPDDLLESAAQKGIVIESNPYDVGYYSRYFGFERIGGDARRQGWHDCNGELAFESTEAI